MFAVMLEGVTAVFPADTPAARGWSKLSGLVLA